MIQKYTEEFKSQQKFQISWLDDEKSAAIQRLAKTGFPNTRMEEWKDINLSPITENFFAFPVSKKKSAPAVNGFWEKFPHVIFRGGYHEKTSIQIKGVKVQNFSEALKSSNPDFQTVFDLEPKHTNAFLDLNTAFVREGAVIHIQPDTKVDQPIYLVYVTGSHQEAHHYRNLILVEKGSSAQIIEVYVSDSNSASSLTVPVTQILLQDGAHLEHVKLQSENSATSHVSNMISRLNRASKLKTFSFSFGGGVTRNDILIDLHQPESECVIDGLYITSVKQVVDHHTVVEHTQPHCQSSQVYKGVLLDESHGIFEGKILVGTQAQGTDARQLNQNLLLSNQAQIHTAPQLQILADDVKCSHGATIGKLDEDQVFYLRARGIEESHARKMLIHAYTEEVVSKIKIPSLVDELQNQISNKIRTL